MKFKVIFSIVAMFIGAIQFVSAQKTKLFSAKHKDTFYGFEPSLGRIENPSDLFNIENKKIRLLGPKPGYLITKDSYKNFELRAQYRWNSDSTITQKPGKKNSGLMYLVPHGTKDTLWPKGFQYQIKEGGTGDFVLLQEVTVDVKGIKTTAGRSVTSARFLDAEKPLGEWNTIVITKSNGVIKQELNGILVNEGTNPSINEGRILLQFEGYPIDFRKIYIRKKKK